MSTKNLINTDRIPLSKMHKSLFIVLCFTAVVISTSTASSIYYFTKSMYFSGIYFLISACLFTYFLTSLRRKIATGYISNNMVILKLLNNRNYVLEFRCIKTINTYSLFGYKISKVNFKFDGNKYICYLFGSENGQHAGDVLLSAKKDYFKKKKASHKPGSVHSAS